MKLAGLKNKFRAAAFSGLAAAGLLAGCSRAPDTQLEIDPERSFINIGFGEWSAWTERQYLYLENDSNRVHYDAWLAQLDAFKDVSLLEKAAAANDLVNGDVMYYSDSANYHADEYFASGVQTVLTGVGDCEDFAIAKYYALQYLGVPESRMAILAVGPDTSRKNMDHAVLAVDTSAANDWANCLVLDNDEYLFGYRTGGLTTLGEEGYKPFYMISELEIKACRLKTLKPPKP